MICSSSQVIIISIIFIVADAIVFFLGLWAGKAFDMRKKKAVKNVQDELTAYFLLVIDRFAYYMDAIGVPKEYINESILLAEEDVEKLVEKEGAKDA